MVLSIEEDLLWKRIGIVICLREMTERNLWDALMTIAGLQNIAIEEQSNSFIYVPA